MDQPGFTLKEDKNHKIFKKLAIDVRKAEVPEV